MMLFLRWLILGFLFASSMSQAEVAVPVLKSRVTDLTQTLSAGETAHLDKILSQLEQAKGSQIAVLIVPTTQPETIEQFSIRVVEQWKLGRKGVDDGVLLLVAKEDRTVRIEVGYGLEGAIPDVIANRVINEYIIPSFKQGDFYPGIVMGIQKLSDLIQGESLPEPSSRSKDSTRNDNWTPILFFVVLAAGSLLKAAFGRILGSGVAGAIAGIIGWFILSSVVASAIIGILAFVFILGGGHGFGGGYGGGHGGGFGSGGGFSGGGGGFGGGGASGRW